MVKDYARNKQDMAPESGAGSKQELPAWSGQATRRRINIAKDVGAAADVRDIDDINRRLLKGGVLSEDKTKRYWVDAQGRDCYEIYARGLDIKHSANNEVWQWKTEGLEGGDSVEIAELIQTQWLEAQGSFYTTGYLSQTAWYKVSFLLKLTPGSNLRDRMVDLKLCLPESKVIRKGQEWLPRDDGQWHELEIGKFNVAEQRPGTMTFSMSRYFDTWGRGLIIKGVKIEAIDR